MLWLSLAGCWGVVREECASPPPPPERPNILVIDVDTLRADRVEASRAGEPLMPRVDALADAGARFDLMIAQSGWTGPSLAALLNGRYPWGSLRADRPGQVIWLASGASTLPEIASLYGYETAAFWGPTIGAGMRGFERGFRYTPSDPWIDRTEASRDFLAWLGDRPKEPWLALVHTVDLHQLSDFPPAALHRFAPDHVGPCVGDDRDDPDFEELVAAWARELGLEGARDLLVAHYDGAVHHTDAQIGMILDGIADAGIAERTVVVVTSNHGEQLFEHGRMTHGAPYEAMLRVPLVIRDPRRDGGRRIDAMVQTIDVAPTLLDLAGIPIDQGMDGASLVSLIDGGPTVPERLVFSISTPRRMSVRSATHHMLRCASSGCPRRAPNPSAPVYELYDLVTDPTEQTNVYAPGDPESDRLREALEDFRSRGLAMGLGAPAGLSEEARRTMQERGYWDRAEEPGTPAPGP
jgi:arylsulfatase A-like enzyme